MSLRLVWRCLKHERIWKSFHSRPVTLVSQELNQKEIPDLNLAPSAVKRLKELEEESPGSTLRVTVEGGGCSGFQYKFTLDEKTQQDDL
eukprot:g577.t1